MNNEFENRFDADENNDVSASMENTETEEINREETFEDVTEEAIPSFDERIPEFNVTHTIKKEKRVWPKVVALSVVAGILFGATFSIANGFVTRLTGGSYRLAPTQVILHKAESEAHGQRDISAIAEACMPSVVAITNHSVSDVITFFGTYQQESTSSGSGIIIGQNDTELLIVTNYHVVANTKELSVVFSPVEKRLEENGQNGKITDEDIPHAVVKGYDVGKDLAVISVKLADVSKDVLAEIKVAQIGDSSKLKQGDQVVAIGNALGYGQSVTTGIISAVNRSITMKSSDGKSVVTNSFIQTDAAINSGNSGGALLDMSGNLIGINSVKIATTGVEGMGYAIPISEVEGIIDELMLRRTREMVDEDKQGFLGITGTDVDSSSSEAFGMPVGVFVTEVIDGLGAQKAGIKKGYIITKFDGYTVSTLVQLQDRLKYYKEGEKVSVTVMVPGAEGYTESQVEVKLSNRSKNIEE
ncbi:MAG: trypsin-like peptidase domain-containing protein [Clostridia bacterium]|nr:trypsin-like peptidase domain-containing protein [Clostridia bacterium]